MKSLAVFLVIIFILAVGTRKKDSRTGKDGKRYDGTGSRKKPLVSGSADKKGTKKTPVAGRQDRAGGTGRSSAGTPAAGKGTFGRGGIFADKLPRRTPKPDLYRLEDRDNDWLARQIREEARIRNSIDQEIKSVKLKRQIEGMRRRERGV